MGRVATLYRFKVRQFFGPLRHSVAAIVLLVFLAVTTLPVVFLVGLFLPETPVWTSGRLGELLAAGLSAFLAFDLMFGLSGGTMTHPSEIDFFATSRLLPREYLLADLLFQFTVTNAFAIPIAVVAGAGLALSTGMWLPVAGAVLAFFGFATMGFALGQAMGLAVAAHRRYAKTALVLLIVAFLLPSGHMIWPAIPPYADAPLPSSAAGYLIGGLLKGGDIAAYAAVLALFAVAIGTAWAVQSGTDVFPNLRPTMRVAFGQMDMSRQAAKQEAMTRGLARFTRRFSVDLLKGAPVAMMTRLHLTRIVRDGSVLMVALLTGMLVLIGATNRSTATGAAPSELETLSTSWTSLLIPLILAFNWNATERGNLWTVAMSPRYLGTYFRGMYRALAVLTLAVAVVSLLAAGIPTPLGVLAGLVMALSACGVAVVVMEAVKIPSDAFSLRSAIPFIVVPLGALGAGAPVIAAAVLAGSLGPLAWPLAAGYAVFVVALFDWLPTRMASRFEV